jgi:hypothetical protein
LVYILTSEGYKGKGVDIEKDKAWDLYKGAAQLEQTVRSFRLALIRRYTFVPEPKNNKYG